MFANESLAVIADLAKQWLSPSRWTRNYRPDEFDKTFDQVVQWAVDNRATIHERIERVFGRLEVMLDLPHNTYEQLGDGSVIIRKGSVRLMPG